MTRPRAEVTNRAGIRSQSKTHTKTRRREVAKASPGYEYRWNSLPRLWPKVWLRVGFLENDRSIQRGAWADFGQNQKDVKRLPPASLSESKSVSPLSMLQLPPACFLPQWWALTKAHRKPQERNANKIYQPPLAQFSGIRAIRDFF